MPDPNYPQQPPVQQHATVDNQKIEMSRENYFAIQQQMQNLQNQVNIAQSIAVREKTRADELNVVAQRLQADFDNFRRRNQEATKKQREDGVVDVLEKLLPTLDIFKKAIEMIQDRTVIDGVRMIYKKIEDLIASYGVNEIKALGEPFNPEFHSAFEQVKVKDGAQIGMCVEVFQKGYQMGDRIIRHSVVKVGI